MFLSKINNEWMILLCGNYDDEPSTMAFAEFCEKKKECCSDCRLFDMKQFLPRPKDETILNLRSGTFCLLFEEEK